MGTVDKQTEAEMKLDDLMKSKKISLFHSSGYLANVNRNTPSFAHTYKVIFTSKNGDEFVIGISTHAKKDCARKQALEKALQWANG